MYNMEESQRQTHEFQQHLTGEGQQRVDTSATTRMLQSSPRQDDYPAGQPQDATIGGETPRYYIVQQQENSTEEMLRSFTSSITGLLQRFTEVSRQSRASTQLLEQYEARVDEDPERFVRIMENHFNKMEVTEDIEKISIMRNQLKGEARRWADTIRSAPVTYSMFVQRFLSEFNSPRRQVQAYHKLYAEGQKGNESAEEFISCKQALLARLRPNMSAETTIEMIISLLRPALSSRIIGTRPSSIEELVHNVRLIEQEVDREYRTFNNPRRTENAPAGPNTPCRWCQEWHYQSTCSQNPYRLQNTSTNQGNFQRPETAQQAARRGRDNAVQGRNEYATRPGPTRNINPDREEAQRPRADSRTPNN